jgi:hypothetical protein
MPDAADENERQQKVRRNIRRTALLLWLTVAGIFFYMLAKYYWLSK